MRDSPHIILIHIKMEHILSFNNLYNEYTVGKISRSVTVSQKI